MNKCMQINLNQSLHFFIVVCTYPSIPLYLNIKIHKKKIKIHRYYV